MPRQLNARAGPRAHTTRSTSTQADKNILRLASTARREQDLPSRFTAPWLEGDKDERNQRILDGFVFWNKETKELVGLEVLDDRPNVHVEGFGFAVIPVDPCVASTSRAPAREERMAVRLPKVKAWCIDYTENASLWILTDTSWYHIVKPDESYAATFASACKKFHLCSRISSVVLSHPNLPYNTVVERVCDAVWRSPKLEASDVVDQKEFILSQIENIEDASILNSKFYSSLSDKRRRDRVKAERKAIDAGAKERKKAQERSTREKRKAEEAAAVASYKPAKTLEDATVDRANGPQATLPQPKRFWGSGVSYIKEAFLITEFVYSFRSVLKITPFTADEFVAALEYGGPSSLFSALHLCLLRHCVHLDNLPLLSALSWPAWLVDVVQNSDQEDIREVYLRNDMSSSTFHYYSLSLSDKLLLLEHLVRLCSLREHFKYIEGKPDSFGTMHREKRNDTRHLHRLSAIVNTSWYLHSEKEKEKDSKEAVAESEDVLPETTRSRPKRLKTLDAKRQLGVAAGCEWLLELELYRQESRSWRPPRDTHYPAKYPMECLGSDRQFNKYWSFGFDPHRIFVEPPEETGQWLAYSKRSELNEIINFCDPRGDRERNLREALIVNYFDLSAGLEEGESSVIKRSSAYPQPSSDRAGRDVYFRDTYAARQQKTSGKHKADKHVNQHQSASLREHNKSRCSACGSILFTATEHHCSVCHVDYCVASTSATEFEHHVTICDGPCYHSGSMDADLRMVRQLAKEVAAVEEMIPRWFLRPAWEQAQVAWSAAIEQVTSVDAVAMAMLDVEAAVHAPLLRDEWLQARAQWQAAVKECVSLPALAVLLYRFKDVALGPCLRDHSRVQVSRREWHKLSDQANLIFIPKVGESCVYLRTGHVNHLKEFAPQPWDLSYPSDPVVVVTVQSMCFFKDESGQDTSFCRVELAPQGLADTYQTVAVNATPYDLAAAAASSAASAGVVVSDPRAGHAVVGLAAAQAPVVAVADAVPDPIQQQHQQQHQHQHQHQQHQQPAQEFPTYVTTNDIHALLASTTPGAPAASTSEAAVADEQQQGAVMAVVTGEAATPMDCVAADEAAVAAPVPSAGVTTVTNDPVDDRKNFFDPFFVTIHCSTSLPDFLVQKVKYDNAMSRRWARGHKFRMFFPEPANDDGTGAGTYFAGTVMEVKASEDPWECITVAWDDASHGGSCLHVSPWEIEATMGHRGQEYDGGGALFKRPRPARPRLPAPPRRPEDNPEGAPVRKIATKSSQVVPICALCEQIGPLPDTDNGTLVYCAGSCMRAFHRCCVLATGAALAHPLPPPLEEGDTGDGDDTADDDQAPSSDTPSAEAPVPMDVTAAPAQETLAAAAAAAAAPNTATTAATAQAAATAPSEQPSAASTMGALPAASTPSSVELMQAGQSGPAVPLAQQFNQAGTVQQATAEAGTTGEVDMFGGGAAQVPPADLSAYSATEQIRLAHEYASAMSGIKKTAKTRGPPGAAMWKCNDCASDSHVCFTCGLRQSDVPGGSPVRKCSLGMCGRHYHFHCAQELQLARFGDNGARWFRCPQHYCSVCGKSGDSMIMFKCFRCPSATHSRCIPVGSVFTRLTEKFIVCPKHEQPQPKPNSSSGKRKGKQQEHSASSTAATSNQPKKRTRPSPQKPAKPKQGRGRGAPPPPPSMSARTSKRSARRAPTSALQAADDESLREDEEVDVNEVFFEENEEEHNTSMEGEQSPTTVLPTTTTTSAEDLLDSWRAGTADSAKHALDCSAFAVIAQLAAAASEVHTESASPAAE